MDLMRWFRRDKVEARDISSLPWDVGGSKYSTVSQDRALSLVPVFAAARHLSDSISTLPLKAFRAVGDDRRPMPLPQLFAMLKKQNLLIPWLGQAVTSLALRGNAVGLINQTDGFAFPTVVTWISMDRVYVDDTSGVGQWYIDGRFVPRTDLVHIPWITVAGRTLGLSPIEAFAMTTGLGLNAQEYGADWFGGGGFPPAVFKNTEKTISPKSADEIRRRLAVTMRRHEPLITGNDWDFTPITVPPEQAQFIETQKMTANQIAAIYGIDPTEIGGEAANSLTYSTEELRQTKNLAKLQPWLVRFEAAFASWLPAEQQVSFNGDATIRADVKTRWEIYRVGREIGAINVDEIRALENKPPLPDGEGEDYTPLKSGKTEPAQDPGDTPEPVPLRAVNP